MGQSFTFCDEEGRTLRVEFCSAVTEDRVRPYGICGRLYQGDQLLEERETGGRFLTEEETCRTIEMLCHFQVTPCTLCEVL